MIPGGLHLLRELNFTRGKDYRRFQILGVLADCSHVQGNDGSLGESVVQSIRLPVLVQGYDELVVEQSLDCHLTGERKLPVASGCPEEIGALECIDPAMQE